MLGNTPTIFLILFSTIPVILETLTWLALWQRKEYRWNRLKASFYQTEKPIIYRYLLVLVFFTLNYPLFGVVAAIISFIYIAINQGVFRPQKTLKIIIITSLISLLILTAFLMLLILGGKAIYSLALIYLLIPFLTAIAVFLGNKLGKFRKQKTINLARTLRASLPNLKVAGITGSYGKTSVKYFASQLIPQALASQDRRNEEFVIAQDMLAQLKPDNTIYLTEMAAYKPGEIAALCRLTKPNIGLITAIGNQHLELFGSPENLLTAKWELITSLPESGTAVLNADDPKLVAKAKSLTKKIIWFSISKPADVYISHPLFLPTKTDFTLHLGDHHYETTTPLIGEGALTNICAAAALALALEIKPEEIISHLKSLTPFSRTMEIKTGIKGSLVIDDSYSSSLASVLGSINHLARFPHPQKKALIVPLIETGPEAEASHRAIAELLVKHKIPALIYGTAFKRIFQTAAGSDQELFSFYTRPAAFTQAAQINIDQDTVTLIAGRVPEITRLQLLSI